ncbi:hypothetical protein [Cohnella algarum]|uniref:hypothetical protein n=1 Tax=Cohnella algarum TaxID=2044859 RepID=UPI0019674846|nr:hypothetical protein [Cohnella algarum]MBN2981019.1 hypothetical protein [Cohnella algarum]
MLIEGEGKATACSGFCPTRKRLLADSAGCSGFYPTKKPGILQMEPNRLIPLDKIQRSGGGSLFGGSSLDVFQRRLKGEATRTHNRQFRKRAIRSVFVRERSFFEQKAFPVRLTYKARIFCRLSALSVLSILEVAGTCHSRL